VIDSHQASDGRFAVTLRSLTRFVLAVLSGELSV
jgi:hypothetical protein